VTTQDRIYRTSRILAAVVIPFLVLAVLILYFVPDQSGERFAWPISPPINAMLLAAAYGGGVYFFGSVLLSRQWHTVKAGFLPVTVFAGMLAVTTLLHWDRFTPGHIAFILWAILYFTTPFLVFAAWLYNRREDPGITQQTEPILPTGWRVFFSIQGVATLVLSGLFFLFPALMISIWPWELTALTARVLGAMFAIPGVLGIQIARDPRWGTAKRLLEAQTLSFLMILIAFLRARADFTTTGVLYGFFVLSAVLILAALVLVFVQMRARIQARKSAVNQ
jgi:hypothetical protein